MIALNKSLRKYIIIEFGSKPNVEKHKTIALTAYRRARRLQIGGDC